MPAEPSPIGEQPDDSAGSPWFGRVVWFGILAGGFTALMLAGWHRYLSVETLIGHRAALDGFIAENFLTALVIFVGIYVLAAVAAVPGSVMSISAGLLFGGIAGGIASIFGSTLRASIIFLIARTPLGRLIVRRAGPKAARIAHDFRQDAFSYLLFLRLVPIFPFLLVNLVSALAGIRLRTFVAATMIGILPATFAYAFLGAGLDGMIGAQRLAYEACLTSGAPDCRLTFDLGAAVTPKLLLALTALGLMALVPVYLRRRAGRGTV